VVDALAERGLTRGEGRPGRRPFARLAFTDEFSLLGVNHAEQSGEIIVGASGEEELIGVAI
jgi:hypothetical protein